MGKNKYNSKARQVVKTDIDNSGTNEIQVDFNKSEYGSSDASNLLVLPSKKRESKVVKEKKEKTRFLSKAQRKRLEKIVDKKKKKENRAALLESLSQVQATPDEVKQMTTISSVQTIGLRRLNELNIEASAHETVDDKQGKKFSSIAGAKKRLRLLKMDNADKIKKAKHDPNIVGLEESSESDNTLSESDDTSSESNDDEPEVVENSNNNILEVTDNDTTEQEHTVDNSIQKPKEETKTETEKVEIRNPIPSEKKEEETVKVELQCTQVNRDPKIQVARLKLPILGEEQRIMELVNEHDIVIVCGETGSGKTTQIPQFLYEAGYARDKLIGVTEPRRVATVAMAARVGHELGMTSREVSYLMRFEGNVGKETKIKFMTDGVLLKEINYDFFLTGYSAIIIDEAHERSVYTDILLGLLSRIVLLRKQRKSPLKLIIMSATLRVEDFTENKRLFAKPPPVIKIDSRQFPVTIHFNKNTNSDYVKEAYKKTVKIHTRLPEGGILVFVTGQQEINYLVRKLKAAFPYRKDIDYSKQITKKKKVTDADAALDSEPDDIESDDDEVEKEMKRARKARKKAKLKSKALPVISLNDYTTPEDDGQADLVESDDSDGHLSDSDTEEDILAPEIKACRQPLWVLPLYSMLSSAKQERVFAPPPVGARLCVVSTDVAETSLTIPSIKYVVDTGKKKMKLYDHVTGASAWRVVWTSQASADQRSGRAGRVSAGHAYRLYSSAVFQHECPEHHPPDLCRRPIDDLVLTMKCMGIVKVINFPFPTSPDRMQLSLAEKRLEALGLLETRRTKTDKNIQDKLHITEIGKAVSAFPLLPRYGKMLSLSHQQSLLPYTIALVSALTVPEVMTGKPDSWPATDNLLLLGDPGVLLRAVGAAEFAHLKGEDELFCAKYGLRDKAIKEIRKLRKQLTTEINLSVRGAEATINPEMPPPDDNQAKLLRQLLLAGLGDQVGRKIGLDEVKQGEDKRKFKYAYHCANLEEPVFLHSHSILRKVIPEWVVYQELYETGSEANRKMVMRNCAAIDPEWLPTYVPNLCNLGDPLSDPAPRFDEESDTMKCYFKGSYGKAGWELPIAEMTYPNNMDRYRWFARFFLDGTIFPKLREFSASLLSPPSTMVKSWAKLQPRTKSLLEALFYQEVSSKLELINVWRRTPQFLLAEYQMWLPQSARNEASLSWPPIEPEDRLLMVPRYQ